MDWFCWAADDGESIYLSSPGWSLLRFIRAKICVLWGVPKRWAPLAISAFARMFIKWIASSFRSFLWAETRRVGSCFSPSWSILFYLSRSTNLHHRINTFDMAFLMIFSISFPLIVKRTILVVCKFIFLKHLQFLLLDFHRLLYRIDFFSVFMVGLLEIPHLLLY